MSFLCWVKLNVDGSRKSEMDAISAGGVIRSDSKNWLAGFALNKGSGIVIEAEMWGVYEGLKLVWRAGFRRVLVESDSKYVVMLLTNPTPLNHPLLNIIEDCKKLIDQNWSCTVHHIYRESNRVADFMANLGHSLDLGTTFFDDPPGQISAILTDDCNGVRCC